jgi:transcriptional regulator with XRE-family HTH domain
MQLRDPALLKTYMEARDFSYARLGRYAGVSRQFIWQLVNDKTQRTCSREVGRLIEEALSVLPGTLFMPRISSETHETHSQRKTKERVA